MSWNDQGNNNGSRDPWGRNNNPPPDIDELIKKLTLYKMRSNVEINGIDDQSIDFSMKDNEQVKININKFNNSR